MDRVAWILGGGALAAYLWARNTTPSVRASVGPLPGRWVWPIPAWKGRAPIISDGFGSPRPNDDHHGGVDIVFRRLPADSFPIGTPNGSKGFVMPDGMPVLAASDGVVWSAMKTPRGFAVVIDHGPRKLATFYNHLDTMSVTPTARGLAKQRVTAGQPIGTVGADPLDREGVKHLHFEVWLGGPNDRIDPRGLMTNVGKPWGVVQAPPSMVLVARNARRRKNHPDTVSVVAHARAWPGTSLRAR